MKRWKWIAIALLLALYAASGLYVVRGNEQAVVRRFGKVQLTPEGNAALVSSGLHYDLPWPLSTVDRVNLHEVRTLTVGTPELDATGDAGFLLAADVDVESQFITGDKNILHLQVSVQYRVDESGVLAFLYGSESPERNLRLLVESTTADLVSRSGVDFVHPLGLGELREQLTANVRTLAEKNRLGILVEDVTINAVYPPVVVKTYFVDVSNARADKEKYIHSGRAYAEQLLAQGLGEERKLIDDAEIFRQRTVEEARAKGDSFTRLIAQFQAAERDGQQTYASARQMALGRRYVEVMNEILGKVGGKVFLESGQPVDLTIFREKSE